MPTMDLVPRRRYQERSVIRLAYLRYLDTTAEGLQALAVEVVRVCANVRRDAGSGTSVACSTALSVVRSLSTGSSGGGGLGGGLGGGSGSFGGGGSLAGGGSTR